MIDNTIFNLFYVDDTMWITPVGAFGLYLLAAVALRQMYASTSKPRVAPNDA
jgi:hypothetical protein